MKIYRLCTRRLVVGAVAVPWVWPSQSYYWDYSPRCAIENTGRGGRPGKPGILNSHRVINYPGACLYWLLLPCLLFAPYQDGITMASRLEPGLLQTGEYWRVLTGHLTHYSWAHWLRNMLSLVLLQQLFGATIKCRHLLVLVGGLAILISAVIVLVSPWHFYTGLAGLLHGVFTFGALTALCQRRAVGAVVLAIIVVKLGWEKFQGAPAGLAETIGIEVAVDAHLYGSIAGLFCWLVLLAIEYCTNRSYCS